MEPPWHLLAEMQAKCRTPFLNCRLSPLRNGSLCRPRVHPCSYLPTSQRKELSSSVGHSYQSSLYAPAAACQLLSTRSCLPFAVRVSVSRGWPYATDPSFPPLQLPANFSAQAANYTTLFKLIPTTKHFRFYLPHAPSGY